MASFPTLSSGAEIRYPAERLIHFGVTVQRFADRTERRWLDHAEQNEWALTLTNLKGYDISAIREFWLSAKGAFDKTFDITITIDSTPVTFTNLRFVDDVFPATEQKEGRATITLGVRQVIPQGETPVDAVSSGLQALYLFDEGAGQVLGDSSGLGRDAQLGTSAGSDVNDPSWNAEGLQFADGDLCEAPSAIASDAFTVCAAVKWTSGQNAPVATFNGANFAALYAGAPFNSGRPIIWLGSGIFAYFELSSPVDLTDNGWHFLVFSAPGKSTGDVGNFVLRADGQDQDVQSTSATGGETTKAGFYIGDFVGAAVGATFRIAFLSYHNRVLTDDEKDQMRDYATQQLSGRVTLP